MIAEPPAKAVREKPILFKGEMVRAILECRKTQTRRIAKDVPTFTHIDRPIMDWPLSGIYEEDGKWWLDVQTDVDDCTHTEIVCPHGQPGDRLWVKETHQFVRQIADGQRRTFKAYHPFEIRPTQWIEYAATPRDAEPPPTWRPSIFMPRWASRITLEITGVRVERLQAISNDDACAEGCFTGRCLECGPEDWPELELANHHYMHLWESINGAGSWQKNPWVWVISFRKL